MISGLAHYNALVPKDQRVEYEPIETLAWHVRKIVGFLPLNDHAAVLVCTALQYVDAKDFLDPRGALQVPYYYTATDWVRVPVYVWMALKIERPESNTYMEPDRPGDPATTWRRTINPNMRHSFQETLRKLRARGVC